VTAARALLAQAGWTCLQRRHHDPLWQAASRARSPSAPAGPICLTLPTPRPAQLKECGIDLQVQELDLTGDLVLSQQPMAQRLSIRCWSAAPWETTRTTTWRAFESSHAHDRRRPRRCQPRGYVSADADRLIAAAERRLRRPTGRPVCAAASGPWSVINRAGRSGMRRRGRGYRPASVLRAGLSTQTAALRWPCSPGR